MATYAYRCLDCGQFEVRLPIGTAEAVRDCPVCRSPARRLFTAPHLARLAPAVSAALTREEQSREAPEVVTRTPAGQRRPPPSHPALSRLPRP
ncbi:zinc ribbon domain-containing protein [Nonomuraea longispora]|uniref:Zinc ribbon domain-containing protein n=1 Tax=Nonomuraea longispora TaxID=1848320 RepID=A0A4R4NC56_9ACTN|nr:FmdB family zinc ribbon protein [Nonomuraea longispora]TDC06641.1 zinc ribbon domain-containing protein [Nonomuraea longispora]